MNIYRPCFFLLCSVLMSSPCLAWPSRSPESTKFQELPSGVANGSYDGENVEELSEPENSDEYRKAKERRRLDLQRKSGYDLNSQEKADFEARSRGRLYENLADSPIREKKKEENLEGDEGLD